MIYTNKLMKILAFIVFAIFISSINTSDLSAEQTTGVIRGSVVDESGNPVSGASVQIIHIPSGSKSSTSTGNSGAFYSRGLRLGGPFKITVTKSDLSNTKTNIFTELGSEAGVSFTLSSSNIDEIVVTAKSANLDSLGVGPGSVFNAEDISTLPSIDRDIKDIAKLDPFVTVDNGGRLSFAGGMPRLIGFIIDGVSANDSYGLSSNSYPTNRMPLSMDVIDQVSVKVANFYYEIGEE